MDVDSDLGARDADPAARRLDAARPDLDPYVRAVMRSRVSAELFGTSDAVRIGRYRLDRHIGTGGGGSVFAAWDGELAREVAVKLIAATDPERRHRALAEGQALAQLSHPNIVPVFDVGVIDERVYLVMELVPGVSLREYARRASAQEIVRAYRQCALGLGAAHSAKLVHRDFKPDNALIADDRRVRVIDFGLALFAGGEGGRAGTPAYMAPEQLRGEPLTAAADQYALAVSLREALGTAHGKLHRVLLRATAASPDDRFATIEELEVALAALDPSARRRRRALFLAPIAIAAAAYGIGQARDSAPEPCSRDDEALAEVWSPARRAQLAAHLGALGSEYGALAVGQLDVLDRYAAAWTDSRHAGCLAHQTGELSDASYDRRQACLESARTQLSTLVELGDSIGIDQVGSMIRAIPELPDVSSCADVGGLASEAPPTLAQQGRARVLRDRLDRARVRVQAGVGDVTELAGIVAETRALGYRPLVADSLLLLGTAHLQTWQFASAEPPLREAYNQQLRAGNYAAAVEAFARYAWVRSRIEAAPLAALAGVEAIESLGEGLPRSARFAQALLRNNIGSIYIAAGDLTRAADEFTIALELAREVRGPGTVELSAALSNLALVITDRDRQQSLFAERIAILTRSLGAEHALVLAARNNAALLLARPREAELALAPSCHRLAVLHPRSRMPIAECHLHLGWLALSADRATEARRELDVAVAAEPASSPTLASAYLALAAGDRPKAAAEFRALLAGETPDTWVEMFDAGQAELGLAMATNEAAAFDRARTLLARARALHPAWSPIAWRLQWLDERSKE